MAYCVIPPYILRKIIAHGSGHQQEQARRTLTHVQHLMAEHWQKQPVAKPRQAATWIVKFMMRKVSRPCQVS